MMRISPAVMGIGQKQKIPLTSGDEGCGKMEEEIRRVMSYEL